MTHRGPEARHRGLVPLAKEGVANNASACDVCGRPASETVSIEVGDDEFEKDLCERHLAELLQGAWSSPRGRHLVLLPGFPPTGHGQPPHTVQ
jgi:hypothetical protein